MSEISEVDPFSLFAQWFDEAKAAEPDVPDAMALATADASGMPAVRMVLLKGFDERGFVFYTNTESRKGGELAANPRAALVFHWKSLKRQVRIDGTVEPVSAEEADSYFATRSRGSQIGAWASAQSRPLADRFALERAVAACAARFGIGRVPRPPHWSGYRVAPTMIEFWQDKPFRLHERRVFRRSAGSWTMERLQP